MFKECTSCLCFDKLSISIILLILVQCEFGYYYVNLSTGNCIYLKVSFTCEEPD